jgi:hypothetical protein
VLALFSFAETAATALNANEMGLKIGDADKTFSSD